jgi:hypothetical protein
MRSAKKLTLAVLGLTLVGGCGPAPDSGSADGPEAASSQEMSAAELSADLSCFLRNATMEEAMERPSPLGQVAIQLESHFAKLCYGRPSARDRVVEGGLIPFGEPWRMGANEATALHLPFPASVGGVELEPGSYSIFAIPGEFEWEFVINSNAERWGIPLNDAVRAADVGSFTGLPRTMTEPVEQFTIHWHTDGGHNGHLALEWGTTRVEIEVALLEHVH